MKISKKNLTLLIENFLLLGLSACLPKNTYQEVKSKLIDKGLLKEEDKLLVIDGTRQTFTLVKDKKVILEGKISTGAKGFGSSSGSGKTPTGFFKIHRIVGEGLESGTVLIGLKPTKTVLGPTQKGERKGHAAEVTTRALTLSGLDSDNKNTLSRNIYIHGTNREQYLGRAASGGCIRVANKNVIKLADELMNAGDKVYISLEKE